MVAARAFDPAVERYVSLATYRRNGAEVRTPVWIAGEGDQLYVFSAGDAGKVKRIRATQRARLAACDVRGRLKSDWLEGTGRILSEPADIARAWQALRSKYGLPMRLGDFFARLSGRLRTRTYIEIRLTT